jgi:hypothetical protein
MERHGRSGTAREVKYSTTQTTHIKHKGTVGVCDMAPVAKVLPKTVRRLEEIQKTNPNTILGHAADTSQYNNSATSKLPGKRKERRIAKSHSTGITPAKCS